MTGVRLIARLDIKGPNLIKGVHLEGLRVIGNPQEYSCRYYEQGADELDEEEHKDSSSDDSLNTHVELQCSRPIIPIISHHHHHNNSILTRVGRGQQRQ